MKTDEGQDAALTPFEYRLVDVVLAVLNSTALLRSPRAGEKIKIEAAARQALTPVMREALRVHDDDVRAIAADNLAALRAELPDADIERKLRELLDAPPGSDLVSVVTELKLSFDKRGEFIEELTRERTDHAKAVREEIERTQAIRHPAPGVVERMDQSGEIGTGKPHEAAVGAGGVAVEERPAHGMGGTE